ncbi:hypothetical protein [Actinocorallia populi]|uniref:hypothetical protein n=1 Tax=Actinocorallia populi TaxID=2079200 RepID=UPI000D0971AA|nr:hypothetical protein [Actinocorallia populi]
MTRNKIIAFVAAGVLAVAAIVGGVVLFRGGGDDDKSADAKKTVKVEEVPAERLPGETETAEPEPLAPEVDMTTPAAQPSSSSSSAPSPGVDDATDTLAVPENVDGCDHAYGATICVPWSFPSAVDTQKEKCAWLKQRGFDHLPVPGRDRHGLDPDKNKMACDN